MLYTSNFTALSMLDFRSSFSRSFSSFWWTVTEELKTAEVASYVSVQSAVNSELTAYDRRINKRTSLLLSRDSMKSKKGCRPAASAGEPGCTCQKPDKRFNNM